MKVTRQRHGAMGEAAQLHLLLSLLLGTPVLAQEPPASPPASQPAAEGPRLIRGAAAPTDAAELRRVLAAWSRTADGGIQERLRLLDEFLERTPPPKVPAERLPWELRRADLMLRSGAAASAEDRFSLILEQANGPADRDIVGRALYGQAQCRLLRGRREAAIAPLERIRRDLPGTRYDRLARLALRPLRGGVIPIVGQRLPALTLGRTIRGGQLSWPPTRATLVLFWHPDAPRHQIDRWLGLWKRAGGLPRGAAVLCVLGKHTDAMPDETILKVAEQRDWRAAITHLDGGFLNPTAVTLGIGHAPSALLIGPGGTLAQRDPTPQALRQALALPRD